MFLQLNHQNLDVYSKARQLISECYKVTSTYPGEEKFNLSQQIRRASISVLLNIAEGSSRKSEPERIRYFEIARGSIVEIDAALDISYELGYINMLELNNLDQYITSTFKLLSRLIKK
ncbi:four helix bundle protein [Flavihumibacter fluvii]|uniref:four helix bundle protein n=1 Tax=Flavihumibacter fluvii TaxID=2838157 RepID=UPI001BDF460F|nr:four helix bundle protein [Flavihumibacter fluvii]ULQ51180.1 four helix bundle protein [Flavihumibacter fluvii]